MMTEVETSDRTVFRNLVLTIGTLFGIMAFLIIISSILGAGH